MATLTENDKIKVMRFMERLATSNGESINYVKDVIRDAAQAVEDLLTESSSTISTRINQATTPHGITLTVNQKRRLVASVLQLKFKRDSN